MQFLSAVRYCSAQELYELKLRDRGGCSVFISTMRPAMISLDDLPDFFSAEDLLRVLPVSRATIYRLSAQGVIPCLRVGRRIIFSRERLKLWAQSKQMGDDLL